jgi:hypothetical protein
MNSVSEINIKEMVTILWEDKITILISTIIAAIISVFVALSIPNTYKSTSLVAPSELENSFANRLGSLSTLAGFAGVTVPNSSSTNITEEAVARINSYDFFKTDFLPYIKLENLMAAKRMDKEGLNVVYDKKKYDPTKGKWVKNMMSPKPTNQEAFLEYRKILNISIDKKTGFVSISIEHVSPILAANWVSLIIEKINDRMRKLDKQLATESIKFLESTSPTTNLQQIRDTVAVLLEDQIQTLMLTEARKDYVFKYIESPIVPEKKSGPARAIICILGTFFGGVTGVVISLILRYRKLF